MIQASDSLAELVDSIERCLSAPAEGPTCPRVARILEAYLQREDLLCAELMTPRTARYVRNLLYRDPAKRFSVLGLVWAPGQGTPIHDHASWGIVGVYRGAVWETRFDIVEQVSEDRAIIRQSGESHGEAGETLSIDPPETNLHIIHNRLDRPSVTIHVYGSEMDYCHVYSSEGSVTKKEMVYDHVTSLTAVS